MEAALKLRSLELDNLVCSRISWKIHLILVLYPPTEDSSDRQQNTLIEHHLHHHIDSLRDESSSQIMLSTNLLDPQLGRRQAQESVRVKRFDRLALGVYQGLFSVVDIPAGRDVDTQDWDGGLGYVIEDPIVWRSDRWMEGESWCRKGQFGVSFI